MQHMDNNAAKNSTNCNEKLMYYIVYIHMSFVSQSYVNYSHKYQSVPVIVN